MSEVRPIDANKLLKKGKYCQYTGNFIPFNAVKNAPTLDFEPVVRCKDCKHHYLLHDRHMCKRTATKVEDERYSTDGYYGLVAVTENHFCSYGAKMDEEVKG